MISLKERGKYFKDFMEKEGIDLNGET